MMNSKIAIFLILILGLIYPSKPADSSVTSFPAYIFPNPSSKATAPIIHIDSQEMTSVYVAIYNVAGEKIMDLYRNNDLNVLEIELDSVLLPPGVYIGFIQGVMLDNSIRQRKIQFTVLP